MGGFPGERGVCARRWPFTVRNGDGSGDYYRRVVDDLPGLPELLRASAFRADNGEWAWPREAAVVASAWLAANGWAVLGGETWLVGADRVIDIPYHWGWDLSRREPAESWEDYCRRGAEAAKEALTAGAPQEEQTLPAESRASVRYNLTLCSEEWHRANL
jgi:hypothetical protein